MLIDFGFLFSLMRFWGCGFGFVFGGYVFGRRSGG